MKTKDKTENWEEEFDKLLRDWHYENIREKGIDELKSFIRQLLSSQKSQIEKAFGGCKNCYGKGYATTIEYAQTCEDFGGEEIKRWQLSDIRFCNCERGKELKKRFQDQKSRLLKDKIKEIEGLKVICGGEPWPERYIRDKYCNKLLDQVISILKK